MLIPSKRVVKGDSEQFERSNFWDVRDEDSRGTFGGDNGHRFAFGQVQREAVLSTPSTEIFMFG